MFHILVVDDDKNIRYVMNEILTTNGYNVYTAESASAALAVLDKSISTLRSLI